MSDASDTTPEERPGDGVPAPDPRVDEAKRTRARKKRIYGFIAMALFVGFGFFFFGGRVPREVHLRFDLPPVARSNFVAIPRARVSLVSATIAGTEGERVATVNLPVPNGLEGPRTGPVVMKLKPGKYVVRAKVRSFESTEVTLDGLFEVDGEEVVVDLK